jgi:hypothetical protein
VNLVEPLHRSSCDVISQTLQEVNEGAEVTPKAGFAAAILQLLATRKYEPKRHPMQQSVDTTRDMNTKMKIIQNLGTAVVNERDQTSERYRTLRVWVGTFPYRALHTHMAQERKAPYMYGNIQAAENPTALRAVNRVGCGSFCLGLHVLYSELGLSTLNQSPHVFAMCYLVHALKLKSRLECASAWPAIAYVSQRYCKDIFVSEKLPSTIEETQARM